MIVSYIFFRNVHIVINFMQNIFIMPNLLNLQNTHFSKQKWLKMHFYKAFKKF